MSPNQRGVNIVEKINDEENKVATKKVAKKTVAKKKQNHGDWELIQTLMWIS